MNPYVVLGGLAALAVAGAVGFGLGDRLKQAEWDAATIKAQKSDQSAQKGTGNAIAQAKTESVRVVTRIKTVTREVPVYRDAQCSHTDGVFHDLNGALRGAGDSGMPGGSGGAAGPDDGRDHGQVD